jgi:CRP/FNR family transcriptional regulator, cyclic AMP receptor protein
MAPEQNSTSKSESTVLQFALLMATDPKSSGLAAPMLSRFAGDAGRELLLEVLSETALLRGVPDLEEFLTLSELVEIEQGSTIIEQGNSDNDIYIIMSGSFEISVNGRYVTTRRVGTHVGEIALVDPTARRTATVVAAEGSLLLKCPHENFSKFANKHPKVWRRIAVELSRRLGERNRLISTPRSEPALFIACSTEALSLAREIQTAFDHDPIVVEIWVDGVFNASKTPIEDLTNLVARIDFAAVLLTPDDQIASRTSEAFGPRDNVVLELGLSIGAIGRERTLIVAPRGGNLKLPSDLLGVKTIDYPSGNPATVVSRLAPACNEMRKIINRLGPI